MWHLALNFMAVLQFSIRKDKMTEADAYDASRRLSYSVTWHWKVIMTDPLKMMMTEIQ